MSQVDSTQLEELSKQVDELTEFPSGLDKEEKEEKEEAKVEPEVEVKPETTEEKVEKKEEKEEEKDELTLAREELSSLRDRLEEMAGGKWESKLVEETPKEEAKEVVTTPTPKVEPKTDLSAEIDFVKDVDLEEFISNKQVLNRVLNDVYRTAFETGRRVSVEDALRHIPDVVKFNVTQQVTLRAATEDFYARNQDLQPYKKVVAVVAEALAASNPNWPLEKLFSETESEARKRLLLHKKATDSNPATQTTQALPKPKFAKVGKGDSRQSGDSRTDFQKQIDDLISEVR
jgi:hypothetical protein